ncbi:MAG: hypothetical protein QOF68_238 [Gaiellales bacterium]|nr:hypothetical protein [Gaiellales bacterium]
MAVMMIAEVPGGSAEVYDRLNDEMGIRSSADLPEGCLSHVAGPTEDGILVVDVWESPEQLGRFVESRLAPAAEKAGMPEFTPRVLPVHNRVAAGNGTDAGVIMVIPLPQLSTDDYDHMVAAMPAHIADGTGHPSVSHTVAAADEGIIVVDIWGSIDEFAQFAENEIAPAVREMPPIDPQIVPVHNHLRSDVPVAR